MEDAHMNQKIAELLGRYLPILAWGAEYSRRTLISDLIAAAIVTVILIPQSLAYVLLIGIPPQVGLYALFGTSRTLAVGPVTMVSGILLVAIDLATRLSIFGREPEAGDIGQCLCMVNKAPKLTNNDNTGENENHQQIAADFVSNLQRVSCRKIRN